MPGQTLIDEITRKKEGPSYFKICQKAFEGNTKGDPVKLNE